MALPGNATDLTPPAQRLPLIDDPGLKLQAIAWSANPAERIAVVNSSILREGDAVEGYRVVRINRDDVMLRGGGGEGRLLFGAK
jgi:type II secretory pathway component PulC